MLCNDNNLTLHEKTTNTYGYTELMNGFYNEFGYNFGLQLFKKITEGIIDYDEITLSQSYASKFEDNSKTFTPSHSCLNYDKLLQYFNFVIGSKEVDVCLEEAMLLQYRNLPVLFRDNHQILANTTGNLANDSDIADLFSIIYRDIVCCADTSNKTVYTFDKNKALWDIDPRFNGVLLQRLMTQDFSMQILISLYPLNREITKLSKKIDEISRILNAYKDDKSDEAQQASSE
jgi:hypothetical protein